MSGTVDRNKVSEMAFTSSARRDSRRAGSVARTGWANPTDVRLIG